MEDQWSMEIRISLSFKNHWIKIWLVVGTSVEETDYKLDRHINSAKKLLSADNELLEKNSNIFSVVCLIT